VTAEFHSLEKQIGFPQLPLLRHQSEKTKKDTKLNPQRQQPLAKTKPNGGPN